MSEQSKYKTEAMQSDYASCPRERRPYSERYTVAIYSPVRPR